MAKIIEFSKVKTKDYDPLASLKNEGGEKIIGGWINEDDDFTSYIGADLSYMELLFIIDTFKRRLDQMVADGEF